MSQLACCQFVLLLNDTARLPFCDDQLMAAAENLATLSDVIFGRSKFNDSEDLNSTLRQNFYTTPIYLNFPVEPPEDHVTFLFGILLLISLAVCCTLVILKLTKPNVPTTISTSYGSPIDYDMMMFLPCSQRRSSVLLFLRGITCRSGSNDRSRHTSLSVVSNASVLPSYRTATSSTISPASIPPPPYYEELQQLTDPNNNYEQQPVRKDRLIFPILKTDKPHRSMKNYTNNNQRVHWS
uniref:Uncharacterized protein n=1 Tax=Panagrolaimus sp. JU765 TaxID=591449 RepID=A0AC34RIR3_9BILA